MHPLLKNIINIIKPIAKERIIRKLVEPLTERTPAEISDGSKRPHTNQVSTQLAKIGIGASTATLIHVDSVEATLAAIAVLLINLVFLYFPSNTSKKQ